MLVRVSKPNRVACLIQGEDEKLHLIVDTKIRIVKWRPNRRPGWIPISRKKSVEKIKRICEKLRIKFHLPQQLRIPYSLNLIQLSDQRVLMTSGEQALQETIEEIIGKDKVLVTPIPIRYFPVWQYAGIRCLTNRAPYSLFRSLTG